MSYGIRYIMTWLSEKNEDCRIEILEKDFAGLSKLKKLGSAPILHIDDADNGIIGTSLTMMIQADIDGELRDLYTIDSKKFKVILYRNNAAIWSGYILQELYNEQYIAPPYDVEVTATDQLALLKDVRYAIDEDFSRKSILEIIKNALTPTGLELGFVVQTALMPTVQDIDGSFVALTRLNDAAYAGMTCYDCLSEILATANMHLVQIDNRWCIYRTNDINAKEYLYSNDLTFEGIQQIEDITIGEIRKDDAYPVGSLALTKIPAKKNAEFKFSPKVGISVLRDSQMTTGEGWSWEQTYIFEKPGKIPISENEELTGNLNAFILISTKEQSKDIALWQKINFNQTDSVLILKFSYLPTYKLAYLLNPDGDPQQMPKEYTKTAKLVVDIRLDGLSGEKWHLTKNGWSNWDEDDSIVFTGDMVFHDPKVLIDKEKYTTGEIQIGGIPEDGVLTIGFRNDSRITYDIVPVPTIMPSQARVAVTNVDFSIGTIQGYGSKINIHAAAAQNGDTIELHYSDAAMISNEERIFYNYLDFIGKGKQSSWILNGWEYGSFYRAILQDFANSNGFIKNNFSGVICGENLLSLNYTEKFSQSKLRLRNGEYNLLTAELSGAWEEIITENIEISDYDVTVEDNATTVDGSDVSSSTNIGVGGASAPGDYVKPADLKTALEPIKDWFTLRTLADGKKILHSKYGIETDAEISIGGISEDIDDDSGSFSRLDSWDDYNPANGDVLSAVLGYGLKTDIQSLQEQIDNMGGGGLSSVTVKIGNTAYDSVDGVVSLPSYPVVPTLLSEFTDDVVAGNYLPIEGGYFANSLNYKSTSAYPLILGSTASAEQSVILLRHNDVDKAQIGWSSSLGTYLYNTASKAKLGINNNGVAYFNDYTLYHTGNFAPADYLPKSGGTITDQLYFEPTSKYISLRKHGAYNAGIGYDTAGDESVVLWAAVKFTRLRWHAGIDLTDGIAAGSIMNITPDFEISKKSGEAVGYIAGNTIIHSGNISSQSVAKARSLYDFGVISTAFNANTSLSGGGKQSNYDNIALWGDSVPSGMQYGMIYQLQGYYQDGNALAGQLAWDVNHLGEDSTRNLWWRANDSTAFANAKWHQIAFTDSNVASAQALTHSNGITCIEANSDGSAFFKKNIVPLANRQNTLGTSSYAWATVFTEAFDTYQDYSLKFRVNGIEAMRILGSGNILIGTTTEDTNSGKLQVNIGATIAGYAPAGTVASVADLAGKGLAIATGSIRANWGIAMWVEGNGHGYIQQQNFGDNTTYSLCLNPFGGNVGIGTTIPAYKLDVAGTGRFTDSLTIGGATLTWDATCNCLRVNTNLATDGELTAGGVSDATVVTEYDSATEIAELNRRITELENRLAAYEQ